MPVRAQSAMRHPGPPYEVVGVNLDRTSSARAKPTSEGVVFHHADDKFLIAAEADTNSARHPFRGEKTHVRGSASTIASTPT